MRSSVPLLLKKGLEMASGTTEVEIIIRNTGVRLIRRGECRHCGFCCRLCPHLLPAGEWAKVGVRAGYYNCAIYDRRDNWCQQCWTQHTPCINFPQVPKKYMNPECGFSFFTVDGIEVMKVEG